MAYMSTNHAIIQAGDSSVEIVDAGTGYAAIKVDGTEVARFESGGNFGIGTTNPGAKLHVVGAGSGDHLILEGTLDSSTTSAPNLVLFRNGADAAADIDDNDLIGQIVFRGENDNSTPQEVNYATIEAGMDDTTDGSEDGHITFNLIEAGVLTEFMRLRSATRDVVVNEQADDIDFRCEGSSDANLLFTDADVDKVGIGTANPAAKLHVEGDARFRASVEVCTSDPAPANTETGTIYQFTKGSAGVFTLPASPPVGTQFVLVNGDGQDIVITRPHSSVKINGATSNVTNTTAYAATSIVAVVSNGNNSEWLAFGGI